MSSYQSSASPEALGFDGTNTTEGQSSKENDDIYKLAEAFDQQFGRKAARAENTSNPAKKAKNMHIQMPQSPPYPGVNPSKDDMVMSQTPEYFALSQQLESCKQENESLKQQIEILNKQLDANKEYMTTYWTYWKKEKKNAADATKSLCENLARARVNIIAELDKVAATNE